MDTGPTRRTAPHRPWTKRLRPAHYALLDAAIALALCAVTWTRTLDAYHHFDPRHRGYPQPSSVELAVALAATVAMGVAIAVRRRRPLAACALVLIAWAAMVAGCRQATLGLVVGVLAAESGTLAAYSAAATGRRRSAGLALGAAVSGWAFTLAAPGEVQGNLQLAVLGQIAGLAVGYASGQHRAYTAALSEHQAAQLQAELGQERLRLARELHDLIAHSMSVVNVQAGYGQFALDQHPDRARAALATIRETSRETLQELRSLLEVLRTGPQGPADLAPAPALSPQDLQRLVARAADAGLDVEVRISGERRAQPAGIELAAYRIVQEALTNVIRHAHTARAQVTIGYGGDELWVEVTDAGRGGQVAVGGLGLAGMRERVALYGGWFTAGPRPRGGFRVAAGLRIPRTKPDPGSEHAPLIASEPASLIASESAG